jgi:hypothetical protein
VPSRLPPTAPRTPGRRFRYFPVPDWATANGNAVPDAITNCQGARTFARSVLPDNYFEDNACTHTCWQGSQFFYRQLGKTAGATTWRSHGQDMGQRFHNRS